ncbi:MAG: hypothetical protein WKF49_05370 [Thermoleophilaceae bacterium]
MSRPAFSVAAPARRRAEAAPAAAEETTPEGARPRGRMGGIDPWRVAPTLVTFALALVYVVVQPRTPDLAAHIFRAELFSREGFTIWNGQWYGGHHTLAYSVLSPPLVWLLGPQVTGGLASIAATAGFTELVRNHFGVHRYRWGALWFGLGSATLMATNRLPFALGVAFGLAACLALQRDRRLLAPLLGVLAATSSPVAGLFVAMGGVAYGLAARGEGVPVKRIDGAALATAGLAPPVLLTVAFTEGGYAPFPFSAYVAIPAFCALAFLVLPRGEHTLRVAVVLYVVGATAALVVNTAMGGNAVRLGALMGGPLVACALSGRIRKPVVPIVVMLAALMVWQWSAAARDIYKASSDPVAKASYFDPVREYMKLLPDQRRLEIPFTLGHWEGAEVASEVPLARGWLRQLDTGRNPIFYKGPLNELNYANWLSENAVRYVALPDAKPDKSAYQERALIESGLPYLRLRAKFEHWRIYEVTLPTPMVISRGGANIELEQLGSDQVLLRVRKPGSALVRVRWTQYWLAKGGCVERDGDWTRVTARRTGFLKLVTRFGPERVLQRGKRCNSG